jgi:hypothetical protein
MERHELSDRLVWMEVETFTEDHYISGPEKHDKGIEGISIWIFRTSFDGEKTYLKFCIPSDDEDDIALISIKPWTGKLS